MNRIREIARKNGWSMDKVRKALRTAARLMQAVEDHLSDFPFDRTYEEMTHEDILRVRMFFAEAGKELTPQEVENAVELLRHIRAMIRGELEC